MMTLGGVGPWNIRTVFDTFKRLDISDYNTSPISYIPPIITVRSNYLTKLFIHTADSNFDFVRCRKATDASECGCK